MHVYSGGRLLLVMTYYLVTFFLMRASYNVVEALYRDIGSFVQLINACKNLQLLNKLEPSQISSVINVQGIQLN
jgi:hypothetical protein